MTDINDIKRELEALTAKVAAYEAEKATKRSWPEWIEAGMCFGISEGGVECQYIVSDASRLVCIASNTPRMIGGKWDSESLFRGSESRFTYLGHARDILTIRTDAHEPTGAELVGRRVNVKTHDGSWSGPVLCVGFNPERSPYHYTIKNSPSVFAEARLAK